MESLIFVVYLIMLVVVLYKSIIKIVNEESKD